MNRVLYRGILLKPCRKTTISASLSNARSESTDTNRTIHLLVATGESYSEYNQLPTSLQLLQGHAHRLTAGPVMRRIIRGKSFWPAAVQALPTDTPVIRTIVEIQRFWKFNPDEINVPPALLEHIWLAPRDSGQADRPTTCARLLPTHHSILFCAHPNPSFICSCRAKAWLVQPKSFRFRIVIPRPGGRRPARSIS